jgi:CheY-like chemotaxis protein/HPt (histidine-containing phosphotransfer) domain-containing protein
MELERVGFAPATLIGSVVSLFMVDARERGLKLTAEIDPSIPVILAGDPHRLHQVLSNLVGNALKFTSAGGVTVRAQVLGRTPQATRLRFEVADTGIGIDPEARGRLFSPFVQVDASTTRRFGGSGLGLAICRRLVAMMGGEIDVDSTPGAGSTFWFTVKLDTPTDGEAGAVLEANEYADRTVETIGARILVAEDNQANVRLIERMLGRLGIDVVVVGNGRKAVSAVRESIFDLVLMDLHMPEMDGLEATRIIRANGHDIPIVALTANAMDSDRQACLAAGMNDYLSKPVRAGDLTAALHRWLPDGGAAGAAASSGSGDLEVQAGRFDGVIDRSQIAELFALDPDGSAGFFGAMVDSYQATVAETMPQIRDAVAGSDWPLLENAAHKLKGVAANVGVRRVFEAAARLVALVRVGDTSPATEASAAEMLSDLEAALGPADEALATIAAETRLPSEADTRNAA